MRPPLFLCALLAAGLAAPVAHAREALGVFSGWAAFRDPEIPRCYAIALPQDPAPADAQPYAALGTWPKRNIHAALHLRLSHRVSAGSPVTLTLAGHRLRLAAAPLDAWPADPRADAQVATLLRSASRMSVTGRAASGRAFTDSYALAGAATALDAAALACR